MCRINCNGGCPGCAPKEHELICRELWKVNKTRDCICGFLIGWSVEPKTNIHVSLGPNTTT